MPRPFGRTDLVQDTGRSYLPAADEEKLKFEHFFRFDTYATNDQWENLRQTMLPDLNLLHGSASLSNFDPLTPARYARWMGFINTTSGKQRERLLAWMGVSKLQTLDPNYPLQLVTEPIPESTRFHWITCAVFVEDEAAAWQTVTHQAFEPNQQVVLEVEHAAPAFQCPPAEPVTHTNLVPTVNGAAGRYSIQVTASQPGWLVVADTWYPGWQARLDGEQVPVLRANYLFRAVAVEQGTHQVEFIYRPFSFWFGLGISLFCWLVVFILGYWRK